MASAARPHAAGGAEGLAHLRGPSTIGFVRKDAPDGRAEGLGRDGGLGQEQARAELLDAPADDLLLAHLGDHHHGHTEREALAHAVHAAVGHERRGAPQDLQLRDVGLHDEVGRRPAEVLRPHAGAGREDDLAILALQRRETVPVEPGLGVEERAERDVHHDRVVQSLPGECHFLGPRGDGRADEQEPLVEGLGAGLELARGVDDGQVRAAEQQVHQPRPGDAVPAADRPPQRERPAHVAKLGEQEPQALGPHAARDAEGHHVAVDGEGGDGGDHRHAEQLGDAPAPGRGRVADEVVGSFGAEVGELGVEHLGGRAHEQPGELVHPLGQVLDARQEGVPVRAIPRTGLLDAPGEGVGRVVGDLLAAVDQLADQRQRRVGVPVQRETEE